MNGNDFTNVNVSEVLKAAQKEATKATEVRLKDWLKQKMIERQNLRVRAAKLAAESLAASQKADSIDAILRQVESGNFDGVEPLEISSSKKEE